MTAVSESVQAASHHFPSVSIISVRVDTVNLCNAAPSLSRFLPFPQSNLHEQRSECLLFSLLLSLDTSVSQVLISFGLQLFKDRAPPAATPISFLTVKLFDSACCRHTQSEGIQRLYVLQAHFSSSRLVVISI